MLDADDPVWTEGFSMMRSGSDSSSDSASVSTPAMGDTSNRSCAHCGSGVVIVLDGLFVCRQCHSVDERVVDYSAEWKVFNVDDSRGSSDMTRCCPPQSELLPTLGSNICKYSPYVYRSKFSASYGASERKSTTSNIHLYHAWNSMTYRERTLCSIFEQLNIITVTNGIPQCILEEAKSLYKKISDKRISRGENRKALIACSLYMACKSSSVPRSVKEIAKMFELSASAVTKGCRILQEVVDIDFNFSQPRDFVKRFCSRLNFNPMEIDIAIAIVEKVMSMGIVHEYTAPSVVAACIFMTSNEIKSGLSKGDVSSCCFVSQVTITKCLKKIFAHHALIFDDDIRAMMSCASH
jgi:transcription initiation factor TFIIB